MFGLPPYVVPRVSEVNLNEFESLGNKRNMEETQRDNPFSICKHVGFGHNLSLPHGIDGSPARLTNFDREMEPVPSNSNHLLNIPCSLAVVCGGPVARPPGRTPNWSSFQHLGLDLPLHLTFGFPSTQ